MSSLLPPLPQRPVARSRAKQVGYCLATLSRAGAGVAPRIDRMIQETCKGLLSAVGCATQVGMARFRRGRYLASAGRVLQMRHISHESMRGCSLNTVPSRLPTTSGHRAHQLSLHIRRFYPTRGTALGHYRTRTPDRGYRTCCELDALSAIHMKTGLYSL